jgi:hypothetical protein
MRFVDSHPVLHEWKTFCVGLIAAVIQFVTFGLLLVFFSNPGKQVLQHVRPSVMFDCARIVMSLFLGSSLIGVVGLLVDKRKPLSIITSVCIVPEFFFLGLWAGYW